MKYIMTEEEAIYMQTYQGHFSRKLASWAISNMEMEDILDAFTEFKDHIFLDDALSAKRDEAKLFRERSDGARPQGTRRQPLPSLSGRTGASALVTGA